MPDWILLIIEYKGMEILLMSFFSMHFHQLLEVLGKIVADAILIFFF